MTYDLSPTDNSLRLRRSLQCDHLKMNLGDPLVGAVEELPYRQWIAIDCTMALEIADQLDELVRSREHHVRAVGALSHSEILASHLLTQVGLLNEELQQMYRVILQQRQDLARAIEQLVAKNFELIAARAAMEDNHGDKG